jgi:GrpB-like predicted nucleotidyltransferase (UPF0157 family)
MTDEKHATNDEPPTPGEGPRSAAMTTEQINAIWVIPPTPLSGHIYLAEYDPAWPLLYEREAARIRATLGDQVVQLEHVGSTSVPGLAAKPRIDILLVVPDSADEAAYCPALAAAGYQLVIREPDWYEHRVFKGPDTDINLHTFTVGCTEINRMLLFRDWLRSHPEDRALYERTKRELASKDWQYTQNYADAKAPVVAAILARAKNS